MSKYISIEPGTCPNTHNVWFNSAAAFADGKIKNRPRVERESAFHIEMVDGRFVCDDDNDSSFDTFEEAAAAMTAATLAYQRVSN